MEMRWLYLGVAAVVCAITAVGCTDEAALQGQAAQPTVSIAVSELEGNVGEQLAGVLLAGAADGGVGEGVAGFAVRLDDVPYSGVTVLGEVDPAFDEPDAAGMWPWPHDVAHVAPGEYVLRVALGDEYCCYSRWVPAADPGLRLCDVPVTISGADQVIEITEIPLAEGEANVCGLG
jgi:hypothetical protein